MSTAAEPSLVQSRQTRQKQAIREAFEAADRPLAPEEALTSAQGSVPRISLATVYRNINALVDDKWLVRVDLPGFPSRYEVAGKKHHHHFHCRQCGKVFRACRLRGQCETEAATRLPRHRARILSVWNLSDMQLNLVLCDRLPCAEVIQRHSLSRREPSQNA